MTGRNKRLWCEGMQEIEGIKWFVASMMWEGKGMGEIKGIH